MKIKSIVQNTAEWLALRGKKIGASDANIIMGVSEFKTVRQLWKEKLEYVSGAKEAVVNEDEKKNTFITDRGHKIEPKIRAMMELEFDVELQDLIIVSEDPELDFLMASLDGYGVCEADGLKYTLECKYVGQEDYLKVKNGQILEQYKPQIMQQLFLSGADKCILAVACLNNDDLDERGKPKLKYAWMLIDPDKEYIKKELLPKLVWFWNCVMDAEDTGLSYDDILEDDSDDLSDALTRYAELLKEQDEVSSRVEKLKKEIFKMAKHDKVICKGIKVYTVKTKGKSSVVIDYEKLLNDNGIKSISDDYKSVKESKGSVSYQIKFPKPEENEDDSEPKNDVVPTKRKRRTKAEIEADKLKGE